ncbi:hypothetical protein F4813DRAFT_386906 [Daldinia decipiens]|uniref:uncharacterized protein n=1 Tax=Daldinia decipiens TaxID=326647 RepID=UPI0020C365A4|nr:uncharacterized protein F4813DRAFT_386906 [Daldinia decipiens]KAI1660035.1 hypothetical protein F4813DRAFT_386906 [Daldinia decipiens]
MEDKRCKTKDARRKMQDDRSMRVPREGIVCPPSYSISERCSSSQASKGSDGNPPEAGLEDAFVGLEASPDLFGCPGAFDVLDYYTGDDPGGIFGESLPDLRPDVCPEVYPDVYPDVYPEICPDVYPDVCLGGSGGESCGELGDVWSGVPMPGQFPMSNWLVGRFNVTHGDDEYSLSPGQPLEAQFTDISQNGLGFGPNMGSDLDLSSLNFIDPSAGQPSLLEEEQSGLSTGTRSEKGSAEHLTGPDFVCEICDVSFPSQGKLNTHNRRHERNHRCKQCDRRFSEARDLRRHEQSIHQQEWDQCPQCEKKFKRRGDNLRRHMTQYCKFKNRDRV